MTIMSFNYTKKDGEISNRVFVPISIPSNKYFGVDITELDIEDQVPFGMELEKILEEQRESIEQLMVEYDIKHNYRFFFPENMSNISED